MKVLFVTHYSELYGANRSLLGLIENLKNRGVNISVLLPREGPLLDKLNSLDIKVYIINFHYWVINKKLFTSNSILSRIKYIFFILKITFHDHVQISRIKKEIEGDNPDVIYSNSSVINFGLKLSKRVNKPHVWHLREFGYDDYGYDYFYPKFLVKKQFSSSNVLIAISDSIKHHYSKYSLNNTIRIYNGVINPVEGEYIKSENNGDTVIFGIIGLLSKNKGQEDAINAFYSISKKYSNVKLVIAGNGPYEDRLRELVEELNVRSVEFIGYIEDPNEFYEKIDITLVCSENEAFGRVTIEAFAHSLPVIGYNNAGTSEIIENMNTGLLYGNDFESLEEKMTYLLDNKNEILRLGNNARLSYLENFTVENNASKIYNVLLKLHNK